MNELLEKKLKNGREYRKMAMDVAQGDDYWVEGYATTFNEPYHLYYYDDDGHEVKEQVDRNAFAETDMSDVIFQYDHEGRVFARLSNDTLELKTDDHGLFVRAYLGGTDMGRNLYEEIKGGYTNKMSFGFTVNEDEFKEEANRNYIRTIRRIGKLYDVSAVSLPQNDMTEISARSHCDGAIAEIESERIRVAEEQRVKAEKMEHLEAKLKALKGETDGN